MELGRALRGLVMGAGLAMAGLPALAAGPTLAQAVSLVSRLVPL